RQSRIHSVGLPARTSLLPEPPPTGSGAPPPIPRRHSATPAVNRRKASDPTPPPSSSILAASWSHDSSNEKLIDLGPYRGNVHQSSGNQEYSLDDPSEENEFVADFDKANFEEDCEKSSFEELQKASRDLEKRLHERIVKSAETKVKNCKSGRDGRQRKGNTQSNR
ncbi:hypothetical protein WH47_10152, partial [Habropoda laboriosa]